MSLKEKYETIANSYIGLNDLPKLEDFVRQAKIQGDNETSYRFNLLIINLYLENNMLDQAFELASSSINDLNIINYPNIYISYLEVIIYICVSKKNYKSAYRYALIKRNYLDDNNTDVVNRWYLEMSYIYAELDQKDKAITNLLVILNNYPTMELESLVLSNLARLYIDEKELGKAKDAINKCIPLIKKLEDYEGLEYINYLNAKLYVLEDNYLMAKMQFQVLFKERTELEESFLGIGNEYLKLLLDLKDYETLFSFINRYRSSYLSSNDAYNKKLFLENNLLGLVSSNMQYKNSLYSIIMQIITLDQEIRRSENLLFHDINEDDKYLEVNAKLNEAIIKIEKTIHLTKVLFEKEDIRTSLISFFKELSEYASFDSSLLVVFNETSFDKLPDFLRNKDRIKSYNYKKERLYERLLSYSDLEHTVIEKLMVQNQTIIASDIELANYKTIIQGPTYDAMKTAGVVAVPLYFHEDLFASVIFKDSSAKMMDNENIMLLKLGASLLTYYLTAYFYKENEEFQSNVLNLAIESLQEGMFYLDLSKDQMIINEALQKFLNVHNPILARSEYKKLISPKHLQKYEIAYKNIGKLEANEIIYALSIQDQEFLVKENLRPYISSDGKLVTFVGTITKLEEASRLKVADFKTTVYNQTDFQNRLKLEEDKLKDLEYKFTVIAFRIVNLNKFSYQKDLHNHLIEEVYKKIEECYPKNIYLLDNFDLFVFTEQTNQRSIEKEIKDLFQTLSLGIDYQGRKINLELKTAYIRYPRDNMPVLECFDALNLALMNTDEITMFDRKLRASYLEQKAIKAAFEKIEEEDLEILYLSYTKKDQYEAFFNLKGMPTATNPLSYLDVNELIEFESSLFNKVLLEIENKKGEFYFKINIKTILDLIGKNEFALDDSKIYEKLNLIIYDYHQDLLDVIKYLKQYNLKVFLDLDSFKKLKTSDLYNLKIEGINIDSNIVSSERDFVLKFAKENDLTLLTNYAYPDYEKILVRGKKIKKGSELVATK
ncbi:MAG TPA: hypothetical protein GXZ51_04185 [Acholeplasma sp.]|nr:hypothetical protein [Acholeplasma sp.]